MLRLDAAGAGGSFAVLDLEVVAAEESVQLADVADLGAPGVGPLDALRIGDHAHHQSPNLVGLGENGDRVAGALAHLGGAVGAEHDGSLGEDRLRLGKDRSVAAVEGTHDLAGELQVRRLVLADRHSRCLVDHDVGGLEDRVVEQAHAVLDALLTLLLVGRRALDPADRHDRVEDPGQLGVLRMVGLADQGAAPRIEAHGKQVEHHLVRQPPQLGTVVHGGQRVVVDDSVDRVELVLHADVVDLRAQVVPQVRGPGRLDPAEDALVQRTGRGLASVEGLAHGRRVYRTHAGPPAAQGGMVVCMTDWQRADRPRSRIGRGMEVHASIGSTNDRARELLDQPGGEGRAVVSEEQTAGRGRRGRSWLSPAGRNLMVSVAVRPRVSAADAWQLGLAVALGARTACAGVAPVALKWPNDLVSLDGAKLGGLLVETTIGGDRITTAVIGIGLNVNWPRAEMPEEIAAGATSLSDLAGRPIDRAYLLAELLDAFDLELVAVESGHSPLARYRQACATLGTEVGVETGTGRVDGRAVEIDERGALVIDTLDGRLAVTSGEIVRVRSGAPA